MNPEADYLSINRENWNRRVDLHLQSEFYGVQAFKAGKSSLNDIELKLLGNVKGLSILHLQCHFGQDSLSLARMGADVCGVDLSDKAIEAAKNLAAETGLNAEFICCNVYDLPQHLNRQFDIVFTSYGTIGWLPDIQRWAAVVNQFLKPGGRFVFAEFHPVVWMFDNDFERVAYRYFRSEAIVETESGSYADRSSETVNQSVTWNHGLGEVIGSLLNQGLQLQTFEEFDYAPYNCFNGCAEMAPGQYRIAKLEDKIPMVYAISAQKPL